MGIIRAIIWVIVINLLLFGVILVISQNKGTPI